MVVLPAGNTVRVIAGVLRSRRLLRPPAGVRPTSDRVREALFARLGDPTDARVLDLFAGTGALSIEALSRGAARAVLVDRSHAAIDVIQRNVAALGLGDRVQVLRGDAVSLLPRLRGLGPFDLVFLDPPYAWSGVQGLLARLVAEQLLAPDAVVVVEGAKRHSLDPPTGLLLSDERSYGDTRIHWLRRDPGPSGPNPSTASGHEPRA